jgi:O-antigen/teichoic acid export membrane protein
MLMVSRKSFRRDAIWNIAGQLFPAIGALIALPVLFRTLGAERLGILSLAWALVGYFSILDLGIGRAITHFVASADERSKDRTQNTTISTGLIALIALGLLGGLTLALVAAPLCMSVLKMKDELRTEAVASMLIVAAGIPVVLCSTGFRSLLEGTQAFRETNLVRIPIGIASFLCPALLSLWWPSLVPLIVMVIGIRIAGLAFLLLLARRRAGEYLNFSSPLFNWIAARRLISYGGWVTVSNVLAPIMYYADRILIGSLVSVALVAYYSTTFDTVTKALLLPAAIAGVFFSRISSAFARDVGVATSQYYRTLRIVCALFIPLMFLLFIGAHALLSLWMGEAFADISSTTARVLVLGVILNGIAHVPFAALQGCGRPDLTARLHIFEVPCYLILLFLVIPSYGIEGAAAVWSLRAAVDAALLLWLANRVLRPPSRSGFR